VRWIRKTFKRFISNFRDSEAGNKLIYLQKVQEMCNKNKQSLEINYRHLREANPTLAMWISYEPGVLFPYLNAVALESATAYYSSYEDIHPEIYVKIVGFEIMDKLRDLRQKDIGNLIKIQGVITKRSAVFSQLKKAYYLCVRCGDRKGPIFLNDN